MCHSTKHLTLDLSSEESDCRAGLLQEHCTCEYMDAEERHIRVLLIYGLENSAAYHLVVIVVTTNTITCHN